MPVRVTGMVSGLDTEALVSAMVSAYSVKKKKSEKTVQTMKWKQDTWASLNTKIKSLYSSVSNLRFSSAYSLKKATISDPTKATVSAGANAVIGSQKLKVKKLASAGYITGGQLSKNDGKSVTSSTKLSELTDGFSADGKGSISIKTGGNTKNIEITKDTTISSFVNALKEAGVSANFDEKNGRIFVSAKSSGVENDFSLVANDEKGSMALSALGLNVQSNANEQMYKQYADYAAANHIDLTDRDNGLAQIQALLSNNNSGVDSLTEAKDDIKIKESQNAQNKENLEYAKAQRDGDNQLNAIGAADSLYKKELIDLLSEKDLDKVALRNDDGSYNYATNVEEEKDSDGNPTGKYIYTYTDRLTGEEKTTNPVDKQPTITDRVVEIAEDLANNYGYKDLTDEVEETEEGQPARTVNKASSEKISRLYTNMQVAQNFVADSMKMKDDLDDEGNPRLDVNGDPIQVEAYPSKKQAIDDIRTQGIDNYISSTETAISDNNTAIADARDFLDKHKLIDTGETAEAIYDKLVKYSKMNEDIQWDKDHAEDIKTGAETARVQYSSGAVRVNAENAEIELNGATYTGESNNFSINGLSISVTGVTKDDEEVTITTDTDGQAIYDKIKDFLKQYNEIINEMNKLYNADKAKGYEPLSDEEKKAMSDDEVEKWEKKIKDSLLRRDDTLGSIINGMATAMYAGHTVNGKNYSLASFGIKTKSYFEISENDNYAYHIDGDKDDTYSSGNSDKLLKAITEDADSVVNFFQQLSEGLYKSLDNKMKSSTLSSAYTIYNDKQMKSQLAGYEKEVSNWEKKITDYEDYWYKKYASMESTLAKLQSQTSSLASMLG